MKKADTPTTPPPRKKMPAEVFVKTWLNRLNDAEEKEWKEWIAFDNVQGDRRANLYNVEVEENIPIEGGIDPLLHLVLSNCHLSDCDLINTKIRSVTIKENSTIGDFGIKNSTTGDFVIENSIIRSFLIMENSMTGYISVGKNSMTGNFSIVDSKTTGLFIEDKSSMSKVFIWHSYIRNIEVDDSFINHLKCHFPLKEPAHLIFEKSDFAHLDFSDSVLPEFTTLNISDCKVNRLTLNNFCNYGSAFFSRLKPLEKWKDFKKGEDGHISFKDGKCEFEEINDPEKFPSTLRLTDSDLGKMQFINCDLRQFERFEFSNTKMLEVFVAGSQMPRDTAFCLPDDEKNPATIAEQKRLAYGQFKKIYEARGDVAGSLRYLSYEMRAYREVLSQRIKRHRVFSRQWFDYVGELGILWLNQVSTNYGNNWLRGVLVTLFVTVVCFSIYCFLLGYRPQPVGGNWVKFGDLASHSLAYLNPFRDEDSGEFFEMLKEDNLKVTWYARFWDFFSRIIVAYFVYQTIQAFRKLGKSSG